MEMGSLRKNDDDMRRLLERFGFNFAYVFTKADHLTHAMKEKLLLVIDKRIKNTCEWVITSARNRAGIDELKENILALAREVQ
jgi:GTP-binding protein EngB required for normal cell division